MAGTYVNSGFVTVASGNADSIVASCEEGDTRLSGGAEWANATNVPVTNEEPTLSSTRPVGDDSWRASGANELANNHRLHAFVVVCMEQPDEDNGNGNNG